MLGDALSHKELEPASFPPYLPLVQRFILVTRGT